MTTEFFWRLPLGSDGPDLAVDTSNRGSARHKSGDIAPGRLPDGSSDGFTYFDYIAQFAKSAELAGFEGALLPTGPEPWIAAAAPWRFLRIRTAAMYQAPITSAACPTISGRTAIPDSFRGSTQYIQAQAGCTA